MIAIFTTTDNLKEARKLAKTLVEQNWLPVPRSQISKVFTTGKITFRMTKNSGSCSKPPRINTRMWKGQSLKSTPMTYQPSMQWMWMNYISPMATGLINH